MTTLPTAPTLNLVPGSDTGLSHRDGITDDTSPVIIGTTLANSLVTLTDADGALRLTTRADKNGNYQVVVPNLATGVHVLTATATDAAGNSSRRPRR